MSRTCWTPSCGKTPQVGQNDLGGGLKGDDTGSAGPRQRASLAQQGCRMMQGFYFSKPLPVPELTRLLEGENPIGDLARAAA